MQNFTVRTSSNASVCGSLRAHPSLANRERLHCRAEDKCNDHEPILNRRDGIILSIGLLGLLSGGSAEARSDPYYDELLSKTKGLDSSDLLSKYQQTRSGNSGKKSKTSSSKKGSVSKNAAALGAKKTNGGKSAKTPAIKAKSIATPSASTVGFNPVEVGLGLAGVAGAFAIGQSSKKGGKGDKVPQRSQAREPPAKRKPVPAPSKPSQKKVSKAPSSGTVRLNPGTKQIKAKTKKVGTVQKTQPKKSETSETKSGSSAVPALLVGLLALVGVGSVLGSKPDVKKAESVKPAPEVEKISEKPLEPAEVKNLPQAVAPDVASSKQDITPTPQPSTKVEVKTPKLPPTTGNSPLVIIGGSVVALIAAAAVGGGSENATGQSEQSSGLAPSSGDDAAARAKEAREWIEAWRARQK